MSASDPKTVSESSLDKLQELVKAQEGVVPQFNEEDLQELKKKVVESFRE